MFWKFLICLKEPWKCYPNNLRKLHQSGGISQRRGKGKVRFVWKWGKSEKKPQPKNELGFDKGKKQT